MISSITTLYPVIISIPEHCTEKLSGRDKLDFLRKTARKALAYSSQKSEVTLGPLIKDERGAPLPSNGIHWSLSHKTNCVAAVVNTEKVGIDVEEIKPRNNRQLFNHLASPEEWRLCPNPTWEFFYRYWTAKEAAVKVTGAGIKDLKTCRVVTISDDKHLILDYDQHLWSIEHYWYKNHIISVTAGEKPVEWIIETNCYFE